jgi:hypothetical protein
VGVFGGAGSVVACGGGAGGAGASSTLTNAVSGATTGGYLRLSQTSNGGAGGYGSSGGSGGTGGDATSSLTFDDTKNATASSNLTGASTPNGGAGGAAPGGGGAGGKAIASLTLTGAAAVSASTTATGGSSATTAGTATATTTATGLSGSFSATADTSLAAGQLIQAASTSASGSVDGTSVAEAQAAIGGSSATFLTSGQAVALETGGPNAASSGAVLAANPNIKAAFGASPVFFAIGELGGGYSNGGTGTQTITSSFGETVDLSKLAKRRDLLIGLDHGTVAGSGFTGLTFDLFADGVDVIHQAFTSAATAQSYFTDHAIDVGSLAKGALSGNTLTLQAVMSVTSASAGSGFYGGLVIGDPALAATAPSLGFIQTMAGFGADPVGPVGAISQAPQLAEPVLAAARPV